MESYVITYNDIDVQNILTAKYETIEGKNTKDALQKRFNRKFERLTGERDRYSNVILIKGTYDERRNTILYKGNGMRLCYGLID